MITHEMKLGTNNFKHIKNGTQTFVVSHNASYDFQVGDGVVFKELKGSGISNMPTGRTLSARIVYVTSIMQRKNYVVFGFTLCQEESFLEDSE